MRLHEHEKIVEVMARAIYSHEYDAEAYPFEREDKITQRMIHNQAAAALDAMLEAAVRLGVGQLKEAPPDGKWTTGPLFRHIILRMEASDGE